MKSSRTIKYKALFLLVSFSLNTVVGFACSLGLDMGFNAHHHHEDCEEKQEHASKGHHDDREHHSYINDADKDHHNHHHSQSSGHQHDEGKKGNNYATINASENDNCCNGLVVGFQNIDKQLAQKYASAKPTSAFTAFIQPAILTLKYNTRNTESFRTPPKIQEHSPPDIRILIQSFQI
ncbi:hypothetical protein A3860_34280 [Niastella vici]|uniref:Cobalt transporter n=1 Tax=Niastella vici TaxID=1703345 RepID=A0A1V9FP90_9BACT|nr:hypothetical protein [Niastella vici]OQP60150.1 hypothetical protein A3860_34280 [Niastella vici]